jgi:hypothetical protein
MNWLDLVAPSAAILGLFVAVALIVVAIRQGRAIRRLEDRLAKSGDASVEAPLQRIAELQARAQVSERSRAPGLPREQVRTAAIVAGIALVLVAGIGGVWYLVTRGDGGGSTAGATTTGSRTAANPPKPVDKTLVPASVPPVADKAAHTVAVFNASGVQGYAADVVGPKLISDGWAVPLIDNPPDGQTGRKQSVVMWTNGNRTVAWNVAKDLGIKRAPPLDGISPDQIDHAEVAVLIGLDLANNGAALNP